jgi:hypothetical protein
MPKRRFQKPKLRFQMPELCFQVPELRFPMPELGFQMPELRLVFYCFFTGALYLIIKCVFELVSCSLCGQTSTTARYDN